LPKGGLFMSSKKSSIPEAPKFQTDPNVGWSQDRLKEQYGYLINGLTTEGGSLSGLLGDSVNISPEVSRLSQQYAQSQLDPAYRKQRQDLINTLEANGQLTGSTTASSLANLDADYMASLTGMQAQYGLADVERALNNRVQLYTTGLNVGQNVGAAGLQNQQQMNQFALANYENQVAAAMMNQNNSGGLLGGLLGGTGGALGGAATGAIIGSIVPGIGTMTGALIGGGLGAAGGGLMGAQSASAGQQMFSSGMSSAGMYAGSKYAPNAYTYSRGSESTQDITRAHKPLNSSNVNWDLYPR
jgi:hypothetical protein